MQAPRSLAYPLALVWLVVVSLGAWPFVTSLQIVEPAFLIILAPLAFVAPLGISLAVAHCERGRRWDHEVAVLASLLALGVLAAVIISAVAGGWYREDYGSPAMILTLSLLLWTFALLPTVAGWLVACQVVRPPSERPYWRYVEARRGRDRTADRRATPSDHVMLRRRVLYPLALFSMAGVAVGAWPIIDWLEGLEISALLILPAVIVVATLAPGFATALGEHGRSVDHQVLVLAGLVAFGVFIAMAATGVMTDSFEDGTMDATSYLVLSVGFSAVAFPLAVPVLLVGRAIIGPGPPESMARGEASPDPDRN